MDRLHEQKKKKKLGSTQVLYGRHYMFLFLTHHEKFSRLLGPGSSTYETHILSCWCLLPIRLKAAWYILYKSTKMSCSRWHLLVLFISDQSSLSTGFWERLHLFDVIFRQISSRQYQVISGNPITFFVKHIWQTLKGLLLTTGWVVICLVEKIPTVSYIFLSNWTLTFTYT